MNFPATTRKPNVEIIIPLNANNLNTALTALQHVCPGNFIFSSAIPGPDNLCALRFRIVATSLIKKLARLYPNAKPLPYENIAHGPDWPDHHRPLPPPVNPTIEDTRTLDIAAVLLQEAKAEAHARLDAKVAPTPVDARPGKPGRTNKTSL